MAPQTPYPADVGGSDPLSAYRETPEKMRAMTASWTPAQFERASAPGKWSARKILIHLAQSELALGTRVRMALTTPNYAAQAFDQDQWMANEDQLGGRDALDVFVALARLNGTFFSPLSSADRALTLAHP